MKLVFTLLFSMIMFCCADSTHAEPSDNEQTNGTTEVVIIDNKIYKTSGYTSSEVTVKGTSSLILTGEADQILKSSTVNLQGNDAWLFLPNVDLQQWKNKNLAEKININSAIMEEGKNAYLIRYYNGVYIKPLSSDYIPLLIYKDNDNKSYQVKQDKIYTGNEIPAGDNAVSRFMLKRGHMLVLAENADGTGISKVFVADENHLEVSLDSDLKGKVSFMRVVPWNYITKKGIGGKFAMKDDLGISWSYSWSLKGETTMWDDYVPMFWGNASEDGVSQVLQKKMTNHILSFNEPDGKDQANLTPQKALERYPLLLKMGLRIGSPACTEGKWKTWLAEFMEGCREKQYRVDFIAIHWYDWGNWGSTKNPSPKDIDAMVQRFKRDIDNCYVKYGLPIWITEFNANRNRTTETQIKFLEKALPMLESHPHVERYAYFQPFGGNGNFVEDGVLTEVSKVYGSVKSNPSYSGE